MNRGIKANAMAVCCALALNGCGGGGYSGGGNNGNTVCEVVGESANTGSSFANPNYAFDGNLDTIATLTAGATNGGGSIRGTAQAGVVEPSGKVAGIYITTPSSGTLTVTINTYLSGAKQEGQQVDQEVYGNAAAQHCTPGQVCEDKSDGATSYYGLNTTKTFDAIEAVLSWSGPNPLQIHELCLQ